jgi:hypothetical protein
MERNWDRREDELESLMRAWMAERSAAHHSAHA